MSDSDTVPPSDAAQSNDTRIIDAPFPFNRATADLILRSSDRVDFRVRRSILAEASNFFEDMFQLPQPAVGRSLEETRDALPIVDMEEDSSTLERLLRLCYPAAGNTPKIENLDDLRRVIRAAIKYAMPQLLDTLKGDLRSFADAYPVRVYAIALVLKLEDEARAAAKAFLAFSILESADAPELAEITGKQFNNLLKYHRACSAKATPVANQPPWARALKRNGKTWFDNHSGCQRDSVGDCYAASWWKRYMTRSAALLETTPSGKALLVDSRIDAALKEAADCTTCGRSAPGQMRCFVREFAQKVDEAVAEVPLVIE